MTQTIMKDIQWIWQMTTITNLKDIDFIKKIKCNNINANLNGDIDIGASQALLRS